MSTPCHYHLRVRKRSQYQLNWTSGIGDINFCVIGLSISQSNKNGTRGRVFVEACLLRPSVDCFYAEIAATRGPKPKQISASDYCRICGCLVNVNSIGQSSRKGNRSEP